MTINNDSDALRAEFAQCWQRDMPRLLRYAQRHVGIDDAPDIVSATFSVAWRRWRDVPDPAFPWLIGTARKIIANDIRSVRRRRRITERIQLLHDVTTQTAFALDPTDRLEALQHLAALTEKEREALLLVGWDGLSDGEAAAAIGIKPAAFRQRLSRARRQLDAFINCPLTSAHIMEENS